MSVECEWFAGCHKSAVAEVEHPTVGDVPICSDHLDWLTTDFSPTKMVPPMAARKLDGLRALIEEDNEKD